MRAMLLVVAFALSANQVQAQSIVNLRGGLTFVGEHPELLFKAATPAGGVYLDIPSENNLVRVGLLWVHGEGGSLLEIPAMLLLGTDGRPERTEAFFAVGVSAGARLSFVHARALRIPPCGLIPGPPGEPDIYNECDDDSGLLPFRLNGIIGVGVMAPTHLPGLSWGMEALYMRDLPRISSSEAYPLTMMLFTAGIGFRL